MGLVVRSIESLLQSLVHCCAISPREAAAMSGAMLPPRRFARGEEVIAQFSAPHESTLMVSGLSGRLVSLADGGQQLTALHMAGDFTDLHSLFLKRQDHSVVALSDCVVQSAPHTRLSAIAREHPVWSFAFSYLLARDAAVHRRWIVMLGAQPAQAAAAHLICELWTRNHEVGLTDGLSFSLPLTQAETGNVLGLSAVHVNRIVQTLRGQGLIRWRDGRIEILDWDELAAVAQFDRTYLQLEGAPKVSGAL